MSTTETTPSATPRRRTGRKDLVALLGFALVMLAARSALADHYVVPSGSMDPTVHVGDRIVALKAAYGLRLPWTEIWMSGPELPARGDVVVLRSPEDGQVLLKRVVAVAGDRVEVREGRVWIDGREMPIEAGQERLGAAPHPVSLELGGGPPFGPTIVPPEHVLLMGDNRGNSRDGRSFGFVAAQHILGRALGVYYRDGALEWHAL
jgi:signal peptidase I